MLLKEIILLVGEYPIEFGITTLMLIITIMIHDI